MNVMTMKRIEIELGSALSVAAIIEIFTNWFFFARLEIFKKIISVENLVIGIQSLTN